MADIAATFHWPLSELSALAIPDLANWWQKAQARSWSNDNEQP